MEMDSVHAHKRGIIYGESHQRHLHQDAPVVTDSDEFHQLSGDLEYFPRAVSPESIGNGIFVGGERRFVERT
jgi:hypothetical protein